MKRKIQTMLTSDDPDDSDANIRSQFSKDKSNTVTITCFINWASDQQVISAFEHLVTEGFVSEAVHLMEAREVILGECQGGLDEHIQTMTLSAVRSRKACHLNAISPYIPKDYLPQIYATALEQWKLTAEQIASKHDKAQQLSEAYWAAVGPYAPKEAALNFADQIASDYPNAAKQIRNFHLEGISAQGVGLFGTMFSRV